MSTPRIPVMFHRYEVHPTGKIYSTVTDRFLKPSVFNSGTPERPKRYNQVTLTFGPGLQRTYYVHRLVAMLFCANPRPDIFTEVDHIDGDGLNNHYTNLRWLNRQLNVMNQKNRPNKCSFFKKGRRYRYWRGQIKHNDEKFAKCFPLTQAGHDECQAWITAKKAELFDTLYERLTASDDDDAALPSLALPESAPDVTSASIYA